MAKMSKNEERLNRELEGDIIAETIYENVDKRIKAERQLC